MKKLTSAFMSILLVFGLASCSGTSSDNDSSNSSSQEKTTASSASAESSEVESKDDISESEKVSETVSEKTDDTTSKDGNKKLVVYFSATGSTKAAASYIANETGADLFELVPAEPYTAEDLDWTNEQSRVVDEYNNPDKRDIALEKNKLDNWDEYDTVFVGYPIWWGIAAWPVDNFVKANDFSEKTVIPFCTSSSSGLGESGTLLEDLAATTDAPTFIVLSNLVLKNSLVKNETSVEFAEP